MLLTDAATTPTIYRELDAATRAALRPRPYVKPLVRLVREDTYVGGAGPVRQYSEGLYVAVECNDYPQPFDVTSPIASRPAQFRAAVAALHRNSPRLFAPFTTSEWVSSSYGYYDDCLRWPRPSRWVHPVPPHASYPHVPTLVLDGDLDSLTSPEGAKATAAAFPNSTFVETANTTHVSALEDFGQCASVIVRRFVRTRHPGDTSCAARYHENRLVDSFVRTAAATGWSGPRRRTARVAAATLADVMARWWSMLGTHGVGLQGGRFTARGGYFASAHPVVRWRLHHVAWVRDVRVTGSMRWHRRTGWVRATVAVTGPGADSGTLRLWWDDQARHAVATASGVLGGQHVSVPIPSVLTRRRATCGRRRQLARLKRSALRAFALAASTSRSRGGAEVTRSSRSCDVAAVTAAIARSKAAWLAMDGFVVPATFRTYCVAAATISADVAGGSKLDRVRMFRHMLQAYAPASRARRPHVGDRVTLEQPTAHHEPLTEQAAFTPARCGLSCPQGGNT